MVMQLSPLRHAQCLIVDLPGPFPLEARMRFGNTGAARAAEFSARCALSAADAALVSQPRQRAYATELLDDTSKTILEVPFAVPGGVPPEGRVNPGAPPLLVWPGGLWPWLNPILALDALEASNSDCQIEFWGANAGAESHLCLLRAIEDRNLTDQVSIVPWLRPEEFFPRLAAADATITFDQGEPERGLAFRTRLLHSLWVGTPLIAPAGEWVTDIAEEAGAAWTPAQTVNGIATAMRQVSSSPTLLASRSKAARACVANHTYASAISGLLDLLSAPPERIGNRGRIGRHSRIRARGISMGLGG
jgi:glycosyltransferase involved in cell wall biosynthesis